MLQAILALLLPLPVPHPIIGPTLHENSLSSSRVRIEGARIEVDVRCQGLSLAEVLPDLDADSDGLLTESEVLAARAEIGGYLGEHYRVSLGGSIDAPPLSPEVTNVSLVPPDPRRLFEPYQFVDATLAFEPSSAPDSLALDVRLFLDTSPDHKDLCQIVWGDGERVFVQFDATRPNWSGGPGGSAADGTASEAPSGSALSRFFRLGVDHILSGWDHLAFLLALFLSSRRVRSLAGVVTAFTVAHSVTLGVAATGSFDLPSRMIEVVIALSIAYVAADNLLRPEARTRWPEAFVFGLVHGLGFAGFLGNSLFAESGKAMPLVGFNLGVEAGQLAVVIVLALLLRALYRPPLDSPEERRFLAPQWMRRYGNVVLVALGLYWFAERAWF